MTRYQLSSIFLLLLVQYVQFISTTDNVYSVVRANGIRTRSISAEAIEKSTERQSVTFIDESILSALNDALYIINTPECAKDFNATIIGIQQHEPWAVAMYDASVKVPTGVEYGSVYQFGHFDQCMASATINSQTTNQHDDTTTKTHNNNTPARNAGIQPKYCLADVTMDGYSVRTGAARHFQVTNSTLIHWGICVPASCSSSDVAKILTATTGHKNVVVSSQMCHTNEPASYSTIDVLYGCVITSFVSMVFFCTCYTIYLYSRYEKVKDRPKGCFEMLMSSFSLVENLRKLVKGSKDDLGLSAVNGIKAMSMMLIIAGHALLFIVGGPVLNSDYYAKEIKLVQNAILLNSPLLVDTFLLLSGFLFARLLLIEMEKRNGKINFLVIYIFRYIRLTPAYLAIIALYATWLPKLGTGPLWDRRMNLEQERCQSSWWLNVLYINNYVGNDKLCMFQSWYLATDTQLFFLAPLILYPLWKCRRFGITILGTLMTVSIIVPFVITYVEDLDATFLAFSDEVSDISANDFFINTYVKTHMRATGYLFGLFTGFTLHYMQAKNISLRSSTIKICWVLAIAAGLLSMHCISIFFNGTYTPFQRALYAGLHRFGWSIATSWILLSCAMDYAGPLKKILSARFFVPLSRLTYCAYLTNGLMELYLAGTLRAPKYMSTVTLLGDAISHTLLTFLGAMVLCLIFESPIHGIEKIFLRRDREKQDRQRSSSQTSSSTAINSTTSQESV